MREKAKLLAKELSELKNLLLLNEQKIIASCFVDHSHDYWIISHELCGRSAVIVDERPKQYEHGIATDCSALYRRLDKINDQDILRIKKLCEIIFFKIMGYRIQDVDKAPDMMKHFVGKTTNQVLIQALSPQEEKLETPKQMFARFIQEATKISNKGTPNLLVNAIFAAIFTVCIWGLLNWAYGYVAIHFDPCHYPSVMDRCVNGTFLILGVFFGLIGLRLNYNRLSGFHRYVRKNFFLYRWSLRWKCFSIPSKIKYWFENRHETYVSLMLLLWHVILFPILPYYWIEKLINGKKSS